MQLHGIGVAYAVEIQAARLMCLSEMAKLFDSSGEALLL